MNYTFQIPAPMLNVILRALGELPLKEGFDAFMALQQQRAAQEPKDHSDKPF